MPYALATRPRCLVRTVPSDVVNVSRGDNSCSVAARNSETSREVNLLANVALAG